MGIPAANAFVASASEAAITPQRKSDLVVWDLMSEIMANSYVCRLSPKRVPKRYAAKLGYAAMKDAWPANEFASIFRVME